jgi:hypothetical protein
MSQAHNNTIARPFEPTTENLQSTKKSDSKEKQLL